MKPDTDKKAVILEKHHYLRDYLKPLIHQEGAVPFSFENASTCIENLAHLQPSFIVVGRCDIEKSIKIINALQAIDWQLPVLMINDNGPIEHYIRLNGFDNMITLNGLLDEKDIKAGIRWAINWRRPLQNSDSRPVLIGRGRWLNDLKHRLPGLSRSRENIVIQGEAGSGRETLARAIFHHSRPEGRETDLFVKIDAAALLDKPQVDLWHEFHQHLAAGGAAVGDMPPNYTVFVKDVDCLSQNGQRTLLLIAENSRSGLSLASGPRRIFTQVITATCRDLKSLVQQKRFKKELYYRLDVLHLQLPPLRRRPEDIALLTDFFTYRYCRLMKKSCFELSPQSKALFARYAWPGNVAELKALIRRIVNTGDEEACRKHIKAVGLAAASVQTGARIHLDDLVGSLDMKTALQDLNRCSLKKIGNDIMAEIEKRLVKQALNATYWNRKKAAGLLNISYKSVLNKIKTYQLA